MIYVSKDGLSKLNAQLESKLKEFEAICAERSVAHQLSGDGWHDNPHFNRMQQLEANKSREIAELKQIIQQAKIVELNSGRRPTSQVGIGSVVRIRITSLDTGDETEQVWEIVGFNENNLPQRKLAYNSPLAAAIMGSSSGDEVETTLPANKVTIEVLDLLETCPS